MDVEHWHPVEVSGHDDGDFIADGLRDHSYVLFLLDRQASSDPTFL